MTSTPSKTHSTRRPTRNSFGNVRRLPSGRYQARFTDAREERHTAPETFASKREAEDYLAIVRPKWCEVPGALQSSARSPLPTMPPACSRPGSTWRRRPSSCTRSCCGCGSTPPTTCQGHGQQRSVGRFPRSGEMGIGVWDNGAGGSAPDFVFDEVVTAQNEFDPCDGTRSRVFVYENLGAQA